MLLDTHAVLWLANGTELALESRERITHERNVGTILISAISMWEIGNLLRKGKIALGLPFQDWVRRFSQEQGFAEVALSSDIVVEAAMLQSAFHDDPADRLLVATARHLGVPIMTRDRRILDYAEAGHCRAVVC